MALSPESPETDPQAPRQGGAADLAEQLEAIARRGDGMPALDRRAAEEILGYDEHGLPS